MAYELSFNKVIIFKIWGEYVFGKQRDPFRKREQVNCTICYKEAKKDKL